MHSKKRVALFGFLVWLIPFVVAFIIFPIRESNRPLFESIMPVVVAGSVVLFAILYLKKVDKNHLREGVLLGILWFAISFVIDQFMFSAGPMKMSFSEYISDIGLTYLIIPIVTVGFGYLEEKKGNI